MSLRRYVLIDQETVYAPQWGNNRSLLGLKGSLNEYERDLLRQHSAAPMPMVSFVLRSDLARPLIEQEPTQDARGMARIDPGQL
ncbi:hypothetical protein [Mesorhizobium sp. WSM2239]|uniref:Uncharacterized protein n=1 Tax=Mesorhizobium sp. WSM2239 TaxID=3228852 RepID=A0AAU8D837_9HYPH